MCEGERLKSSYFLDTHKFEGAQQIFLDFFPPLRHVMTLPRRHMCVEENDYDSVPMLWGWMVS